MFVEEVRLAAVDFEDETFRISEDFSLDRMCASLEAVGQIHPAVLLESDPSRACRIVCGFRRLHGLRRLQRPTAAACRLSAADFSTLEVFLRAIWDNLSHRQLNTLELARILFTLKHTCGVEEDALVKEFLPMLGLSSHRNVLDSHLNLHQLHPELRRLLSSGQLTAASAERLAQTSAQAQADLAPVLGKIRLSASLQREVLDLAEDLAAMTAATLAEVLGRPEVLAVAGDECLSPFQRGEKIRSLLYRQRNPSITRAQEMFAAEKSRLSLPDVVRLAADPYFETPRLSVAFDVPSAQAFREAIEALQRASRSEALDRLFQIP